MRCIPYRNVFIHKEDVPTENGEDDDEMLDVPRVAESSSIVAGSSSSMEENIENLNRRIEELLNLQIARHEEACALVNDLDYRLSNIELH